MACVGERRALWLVVVVVVLLCCLAGLTVATDRAPAAALARFRELRAGHGGRAGSLAGSHRARHRAGLGDGGPPGNEGGARPSPPPVVHDGGDGGDGGDSKTPAAIATMSVEQLDRVITPKILFGLGVELRLLRRAKETNSQWYDQHFTKYDLDNAVAVANFAAGVAGFEGDALYEAHTHLGHIVDQVRSVYDTISEAYSGGVWLESRLKKQLNGLASNGAKEPLMLFPDLTFGQLAAAAKAADDKQTETTFIDDINKALQLFAKQTYSEGAVKAATAAKTISKGVSKLTMAVHAGFFVAHLFSAGTTIPAHIAVGIALHSASVGAGVGSAVSSAVLKENTIEKITYLLLKLFAMEVYSTGQAKVPTLSPELKPPPAGQECSIVVKLDHSPVEPCTRVPNTWCQIEFAFANGHNLAHAGWGFCTEKLGRHTAQIGDPCRDHSDCASSFCYAPNRNRRPDPIDLTAHCRQPVVCPQGPEHFSGIEVIIGRFTFCLFELPAPVAALPQSAGSVGGSPRRGARRRGAAARSAQQPPQQAADLPQSASSQPPRARPPPLARPSSADDGGRSPARSDGGRSLALSDGSSDDESQSPRSPPPRPLSPAEREAECRRNPKSRQCCAPGDLSCSIQ